MFEPNNKANETCPSNKDKVGDTWLNQELDSVIH